MNIEICERCHKKINLFYVAHCSEQIVKIYSLEKNNYFCALCSNNKETIKKLKDLRDKKTLELFNLFSLSDIKDYEELYPVSSIVCPYYTEHFILS